MSAAKKIVPENLDRRAKTDIRMSVLLQKVVADLTTKLGIPKNSYYTMSAATYAAQLMPLITRMTSRKAMLDRLQRVFDDAMRDANRAP